jgi:hypothetical protein
MEAGSSWFLTQHQNLDEQLRLERLRKIPDVMQVSQLEKLLIRRYEV